MLHFAWVMEALQPHVNISKNKSKFAECIVGDITPSDGVSEEDKHMREMNAMTALVKNLPTGRVSLEFFNAFERYEEQHPGDKAAHLTKDLDKFDMIMQAMEYEEKSKKAIICKTFLTQPKMFLDMKQCKPGMKN